MAKVLYYTGYKIYTEENLVKVFMVRNYTKLPKTLDKRLGKVTTTKKQWEKYKYVILANLKKEDENLKGIRNIKII